MNGFVAVLSANVGPKVIFALGGDTILWLALIGVAGALIPPLVAFWAGIKVFGLNAIGDEPPQFHRCRALSGELCVHDRSGADRGGYFSMILS